MAMKETPQDVIIARLKETNLLMGVKLNDADEWHVAVTACLALIDAGWLLIPPSGSDTTNAAYTLPQSESR